MDEDSQPEVIKKHVSSTRGHRTVIETSSVEHLAPKPREQKAIDKETKKSERAVIKRENSSSLSVLTGYHEDEKEELSHSKSKSSPTKQTKLEDIL